MAFRFVNTFEGGTNGASPSTAQDYGFRSGTPWDNVQGGSSAIYDSTTFAHGSMSLKMDTTVSGANPTVRWYQTSIGTSSRTVYGRVYCKIQSLPTNVSTRFIVFGDLDGVDVLGQISLQIDGKIALADTTLTTLATSTTVLSNNQWFRLETKLVSNAATGSLEVKLFTGTNIEGTIPNETISFSDANTNGAAVQWFGVGSVGFVSGLTMWLDSIELNDTGYVGSFAPPIPIQYETLFANGRYPYMTPLVVSGANDASPYTMGICFSSSVDGYVHGVAWCDPTSATSAEAGVVPQIGVFPGPAGGFSPLATKITAITEVRGSWNYALFDAPVPVTANTQYFASVLREDYPYYSYYFDASNGGVGTQTQGHLTAEGLTGTNNNFFNQGPTIAKPTNTFHAAWYGLDVLFNTVGVSSPEYWGILSS